MMIVGLTGGIGSGKTTVSEMFSNLGVPVYNSDKRAKKLMNSSKRLRKAIKALFGKKAYRNEKLDRSFIAEKVFNDNQLLTALNAIVHPAVRKDFKKWVEKQESTYVIQEAAIIFEQGNHEFYDKIILVTVPVEIRIERLLERDKNTSIEKIKNRMRHQWSDDKKVALSDFVIKNLDLEKTRAEVSKTHEILLESA